MRLFLDLDDHVARALATTRACYRSGTSQTRVPNIYCRAVVTVATAPWEARAKRSSVKSSMLNDHSCGTAEKREL